MKNGERLSLEQIRTFLAASEELGFEANNREDIYGWVTDAGGAGVRRADAGS